MMQSRIQESINSETVNVPLPTPVYGALSFLVDPRGLVRPYLEEVQSLTLRPFPPSLSREHHGLTQSKGSQSCPQTPPGGDEARSDWSHVTCFPCGHGAPLLKTVPD